MTTKMICGLVAALLLVPAIAPAKTHVAVGLGDQHASTFAARVIVSTQSDLHSAVCGAIGALKGALHGGANEKVMDVVRAAGGVATALQHTIGSAAGAFFAIVLLNASLIGAGAVTLATSYVIGDVFGTRGSRGRYRPSAPAAASRISDQAVSSQNDPGRS